MLLVSSTAPIKIAPTAQDIDLLPIVPIEIAVRGIRQSIAKSNGQNNIGSSEKNFGGFR
jgi:hypothetical protein